MDRIATLFFTILGLSCIFAGYKLFCGLPSLRRQNSSATLAAVLLINVVPGALLALIGTGLLTAEARTFTSHRPALQRHEPAAQGVWWHRTNPGFVARSA